MTPLPVFADQFAWSIVLINTMHGGGYPSSFLTSPLPVKAAGLTTSSETASGNEIFSINLYNPRLKKDFLTPGSGHMLHEPGPDLRAHNPADAEQKSGPIVHVGQLVVCNESGYRYHENSEKRGAHGFSGL